MVTTRFPGLRCRWNPRTDDNPKRKSPHASTGLTGTAAPGHDLVIPFVRRAQQRWNRSKQLTEHPARRLGMELQMSHETARAYLEEMLTIPRIKTMEAETPLTLQERVDTRSADAAGTVDSHESAQPVQSQYFEEVTQMGRCLYRNIAAFSKRHAVIGILAAACAGACLVAACGGGGRSSSALVTGNAAPVAATSSASPSPDPVVAPGYGTPEDAVDGLIQAELAGNGSDLCSYLVPSSQSVCDQDQQASPLPAFTGSVTVDGEVISGSEALVAVTGSICSGDGGCNSNSDPSVGMPNSQETFAQAYGQALNSSGSFSAVPCIEENRMWYVNTTL